MNGPRTSAIAVLAVLATAAVLLWQREGSDEAPAARDAAHAAAGAGDAAASSAGAPAAPIDAPEVRSPAAFPGGSIVGTVVDAQRQPIVGAEVRVVIGEATEGLPATHTDSRGAFALLGVPLTVVAVRAAAPGFAAQQLGDLHVDDAPDHHLELAPFRLDPSVLYQGLVRAAGRGVGNTRLMLAAKLRAPGEPMPVAQTVESDANGFFVFDAAPAPPCTLLVTAPGCRAVPPRDITAPHQLAVIEVEPLPHVTGRIVDAASGAPLPNARILLNPADSPTRAFGWTPEPRGMQPDEGVSPAADGSFDLLQPDGDSYLIRVEEPAHCTVHLGPFDRETTSPHVVRMPLGVVVTGRLVRGGQPIGGTVRLWTDATTTFLPPPVPVGDDGNFRVPPALPGRYHLLVRPQQGAPRDVPIELIPPGPLQLPIVIGDGTHVIGAARGRDAVNAKVITRDVHGNEVFTFVRADGTYALDWIGAGDWRFRVVPEGSRGPMMLTLLDLLDPPPVRITGAPEQRVDLVMAGELLAAVRFPQEGGRNDFELVPRTPLQERVPPAMRGPTAIDDAGDWLLPAALPGEWLVRWKAPDTSTHELVVDLPAGRTTTVTFPQ